MSDHARIISRYQALLGAEHVLTHPEALAAAETATFATRTRIPAILRPADRVEVQACVRLAGELGCALYPISRGKNWGLGSRVPTRDGALLLDLGRLDRILEYNEEMAYVTLEPGVSFGQLTQFLAERGGRHFVSMTGSTLDSSVIGNTLERGDGVGPLGDRAAHVCALEIVLADGQVIETGLARFPGAKAAPLYRWGVGPALDGLFFQSNLGVVTRMTVWLTPTPAVTLALRASIQDPARLGSLVDAARELRLEGTLSSLFALWNDYRVLSTRMQYPWQLTGGLTPLTRPQIDVLKGGRPCAAWYAMGAVYAASEAQADAACARLRERLGPVTDGLVFQRRVAESGEITSITARPIDDEFAAFGDPEVAFQLLQGSPQQSSLASVYFRKKDPPPPQDRDPDRDRCGVLWSCPVVPLTAHDSATAIALCERLLLAGGFEPMLALLAQHDRTAYLVPILCYDRDSPGEDERALACHDALLDALIAAGYPPYRLGVQSMGVLAAGDPAILQVVQKIKRALDPGHLLAPGRYEATTVDP